MTRSGGLEARIGALPPNFVLRRGRGSWLAARRDLLPALEAFGFGPDTDGPLVESDVAGRRPLAALEWGGERLLVRRFTHGGLARWLTGRRYLRAARPFEELLLSEALRARGVATPEVVAARARPMLPFGWRLDLVTRRVPGAVDLGEVLARARRGDVRAPELRRALAAAGRAVRALHAAGLEHADLNANNLLVPVAGEGGPAWVLDLDRSRLRAQLPLAARRANLARLLRHVERRERRHGPVLSRADHLRFLRAYAGAEWRAEWRAVRARVDRWAWLHRLGSGLERLLGRSHDPREVSGKAASPR